jgi:hypothetical protein
LTKKLAKPKKDESNKDELFVWPEEDYQNVVPEPSIPNMTDFRATESPNKTKSINFVSLEEYRAAKKAKRTKNVERVLPSLNFEQFETNEEYKSHRKSKMEAARKALLFYRIFLVICFIIPFQVAYLLYKIFGK